MPTIINPYKSGSGMGEDLFGLGGIADAFFGPKASQSAYTREKFREAQRQNQYTPLLAEKVGRLGLPGGNINQTMADAINAGVDIGQISSANLLGVTAANPNNLAGNTVTAAALGAKVPASSTMFGFGQTLAQQQATELGKTERLIAADQLKNERELINVIDLTQPGGIGTRTRAEVLANPGKYVQAPSVDQVKGTMAAANLFPAPGATPVAPAAPDGSIITTPLAASGAPARASVALTPQQQEFLGAAPKADKGQNFYVTNAAGTVVDQGVTEDNGKTRIGGAPVVLKPGERINIASPLNPTAISTLGTTPGKTEQKDYREAVNHANSTLTLGSQILNIINKNPTAIGPVGNLRRMGQEGVDLLNSLNTMFGTGRPGDYDKAVAATRADMQRRFGSGALALIPELFDDDLNSIQTMNGMLLYKAAAAMGQSGRDASDKDIANVRSYVGTPDSWFQGPNTYRSKVGSLMRVIQQQRDADNAMIQPGATVAPNAVVAPPSTGASTRTTPANPVVDDLVRKYTGGGL